MQSFFPRTDTKILYSCKLVLIKFAHARCYCDSN